MHWNDQQKLLGGGGRGVGVGWGLKPVLRWKNPRPKFCYGSKTYKYSVRVKDF